MFKNDITIYSFYSIIIERSNYFTQFMLQNKKITLSKQSLIFNQSI